MSGAILDTLRPRLTVNTRLISTLSVIGGGLLLLLTVISGVEGTYAFLLRLGPLLTAQVPLFVLICIAVAVAVACYLPYRTVKRAVAQRDDISVQTEGEFLERMLQLFLGAQERIVITGLTKNWIFELIYGVYFARRKGVLIDVVCSDGHHERYHLLELMGCRVHRVPSVGVVGVLADPEAIRHAKALLQAPRPAENVFARCYDSSLDWYAISACYRDVTTSVAALNDPPVTALFVPELVPVTDDELISALKKVPLYSDANIVIEDVDVKAVHPVSRYVTRYKLLQVRKVLDLFAANKWEPFKPCGFKLANGRVSLVLPPVFEEHDGKLYVAEGHTRVYTLRKQALRRSVIAVVVRGVVQPLPLPPTRWHYVEEVDQKREQRNPALARYIETATHEGVWAR